MTALVAPALPLSVPLASTRFSSASIIALTVVAAGASACGRASIEPTTVRDSAGVAIVESHEHAWEASAAWSVDPVPILDLAATASGSTNDFFRVSNAIRRADGSIVVASRGSSTVSAYAPTGELLFSHGRAGDGPGEYRRLTSVAPYRGDSLVAFDYWQQRLTILDADGTHTRVTTMEVPGGRAYTLHPVTDGRFVLRVNAFDQLRDPIGRKRIPQPLLVIHADGTVGDTVAVAAGFETFFFDGGDAAIPFGRESFIGTRGDTVIVGDADHLGFREYTLDGQLQRIVRVPDFPLALSSADRDSVRRATASRTGPAEFGNLFERMAASIPDKKPAYSDLVVDSAGNVWLGEYVSASSASDREWHVFDRKGSWLGSVSLPARFLPYQIGATWILGSSRNELDVETVQVLRLSRQPSGET